MMEVNYVRGYVWHPGGMEIVSADGSRFVTVPHLVCAVCGATVCEEQRERHSGWHAQVPLRYELHEVPSNATVTGA